MAPRGPGSHRAGPGDPAAGSRGPAAGTRLRRGWGGGGGGVRGRLAHLWHSATPSPRASSAPSGIRAEVSQSRKCASFPRSHSRGGGGARRRVPGVVVPPPCGRLSVRPGGDNVHLPLRGGPSHGAGCTSPSASPSPQPQAPGASRTGSHPSPQPSAPCPPGPSCSPAQSLDGELSLQPGQHRAHRVHCLLSPRAPRDSGGGGVPVGRATT